MLSRCTNLGIARAAPPCTSGSANDRRRTRVRAMLCQGIGTSRTISMHVLKFSPDVSPPNTICDILPNSAEQSANIRRCTPRLKCPGHIGDTSAIHWRHIGDARVNIGDAYLMRYYRRWFGDPWPTHRRCSPMFPSYSEKHRRCYGDVSLSVRNIFSDWSQVITWHYYNPLKVKERNVVCHCSQV